MPTNLKPLFGAAASIFALGLATSNVAAAETREKEPRHAELGLTGRLSPSYSSNLYHEQRRRQDDFANNSRGERYFEMEGPADLITGAELEGYYEQPVSKKREARLSLGAGYVFHLRNGIANYFLGAARARYDASSRDRVGVNLEVVPRRFKKNYSIREVAGNKYYEHAYHWQVEAVPSWRHGFTKRLEAELAYELSVRRYLAPFGNRDTTRHAAELIASYDFGHVEPALGAGGALGTTPSGLEFGVPVDRSYRDVTLLAGVEVGVGAGFSGGIEAEYRNRHYTSDEPLNETYFNRTDQRWSFALGAKKRFGRPLALFCGVGFVQNETNRQDHPGVAPEDLGYEEWTVGLGIEATL